MHWQWRLQVFLLWYFWRMVTFMIIIVEWSKQGSPWKNFCFVCKKCSFVKVILWCIGCPHFRSPLSTNTTQVHSRVPHLSHPDLDSSHWRSLCHQLYSQPHQCHWGEYIIHLQHNHQHNQHDSVWSHSGSRVFLYSGWGWCRRQSGRKQWFIHRCEAWWRVFIKISILISACLYLCKYTLQLMMT